MSKAPRAVAIQQQSKEELPLVLASGVGSIADCILELAEEHGVPIHQDPELLEMLSGTRSGSPISEESYLLVAELLSFLAQVDGELAQQLTARPAVALPPPQALEITPLDTPKR